MVHNLYSDTCMWLLCFYIFNSVFQYECNNNCNFKPKFLNIMNFENIDGPTHIKDQYNKFSIISLHTSVLSTEMRLVPNI